MGISLGPWQIGNGSRPASTGAHPGRLMRRAGGRTSGAWLRSRGPNQPLLAWWSSISTTERITTLSILGGAVVAIISSLVWAIALGYIARQHAKAALAGDGMFAIEAGELPEGLADLEDEAIGGGIGR